MKKSFIAGLILWVLFLCSCQSPALRSTDATADLKEQSPKIISQKSDLEPANLKQETEELKRLSKTLGKMNAKTGKLQKEQQEFTKNLDATNNLPKRSEEISKKVDQARKSLDSQTEESDKLLQRYSE